MTAADAMPEVAEPYAANPKGRTKLTPALVLLAAIIAMGRLITCGFTNWDDPHTITENPGILDPSFASLKHFWSAPMAELYIPVPYTIWWSLSALIGDRSGGMVTLNPHVFHAVSVFAHAIAAVVLFSLLRRLVRSDWAACAGAALFAAHPVQVEAVGWVSGLKDVLAGMFSIVALHQYVCYRQSASSSKVRYIACAAALVLAMISKPVAVTVPLMAAAIDFLLLKTPLRRTLAAVLPLVVLAEPFAIIARVAQNSPPSTWDVALWQWPLIATDTIAFYITKIVWPLNLGVDYGRTPGAAVALGSLYWNWIFPAGLFAVAVWTFRSRPGVLAGVCLFLAPLLPLLGPLPFSFRIISTVADHYLYLPMAGVALVAATLLARRKSRVLAGVVTFIIGLLATRSFFQAAVWQDGRTLFSHALVVNPRSAAAHVNLSEIAMKNNDLDFAERLAFEAVQIDPTARNVLTQAGSVLLMRNSPREAVQLLEAAVIHDPEDARAIANLGSAYGMLDRPNEAIAAYERALQLDPTLTKTVAMLARAKAFRDASSRPTTKSN